MTSVGTITRCSASPWRTTIKICSLGGCAASTEWLETHKDEILAIAKRAYEAGMGKNRSDGKFDSRVSPWMIAEYNKMFTASERENVEKYFSDHPEQLKNLEKMSPAEALQFVQRFKASPLKGVSVQ
jgi:hypothetical protein